MNYGPKFGAIKIFWNNWGLEQKQFEIRESCLENLINDMEETMGNIELLQDEISNKNEQFKLLNRKIRNARKN